jgi:hypothetical protein
MAKFGNLGKKDSNIPTFPAFNSFVMKPLFQGQHFWCRLKDLLLRHAIMFQQIIIRPRLGESVGNANPQDWDGVTLSYDLYHGNPQSILTIKSLAIKAERCLNQASLPPPWLEKI